ncbi:MAG TPA: molybdopterin dinucleotide binding domain-containing protein, partial [Dehalococcoidia bacterium]|nr:molybdopterin dinucleotide binding domain-containing protein [Dehalococcoidia bacterium]
LQWPCPAPSGPGTPVLYREGFPHGKARLPVPQFRVVETPRPVEYPLWWAPGRVLLQSQREVQVVKGKVNRIQREEWVQLNPADAARWRIAQGDPVEVDSAGRRLMGVAHLDDAIPPGVAATTGLFGQLAVALQTSEDLDPMSRAPGLDIVPARVVKVSGADRP